jgi:hypothetical protein
VRLASPAVHHQGGLYCLAHQCRRTCRTCGGQGASLAPDKVFITEHVHSCNPIQLTEQTVITHVETWAGVLFWGRFCDPCTSDTCFGNGTCCGFMLVTYIDPVQSMVHLLCMYIFQYC